MADDAKPVDDETVRRRSDQHRRELMQRLGVDAKAGMIAYVPASMRAKSQEPRR